MTWTGRLCGETDAPTIRRFPRRPVASWRAGSSDYNLIGGNMCVGMREPVVVTGSNSRAEGNLV